MLALFCAYGVVGLWCQDQPALLYIVPLSQWTIIAMARCRGHLGKVWLDGPEAQLGKIPQGEPPLLRTVWYDSEICCCLFRTTSSGSFATGVY